MLNALLATSWGARRALIARLDRKCLDPTPSLKSGFTIEIALKTHYKPCKKTPVD